VAAALGAVTGPGGIHAAEFPAGAPEIVARRKSVPALHPGKAAPREPVDSTGVPGRFCQWIPKY